MNAREVTITSKNQITLPAEYVRKLHLAKSRRMSIRQRGDELILKPEPTLEDRMLPVWEEVAKYVKRPVSDKELKRAARSIAAKRGL
jgi:bifunctional DNA-binding transcriptional regulator/antitoxin component of YhaV-PrlF toxin-antitoxin module